MKYQFKTKEQDIKKYLFELKEHALLSMKIIGLKKNLIQNFTQTLKKQNQKLLNPITGF